MIIKLTKTLFALLVIFVFITRRRRVALNSKISEPSSNSSQVRYLHLFANTIGKAINASVFPNYGLNSGICV